MNNQILDKTNFLVNTQSPNLNELAFSLNAVQAEVEGIKKTSESYNYKYADLNECWNAIRPLLTKNDLCIIQTNLPTRDGITIRTTLLHTSGQWIAGEIYMHSKDQTNPQVMGSINTYARRYALSGIIGLSPVDDDAVVAVKGKEDITNDQLAILIQYVNNYNWTNDQVKKHVTEKYKTNVRALTNVQFEELLNHIEKSANE